MSIDDRARHELHQRLDELLGPERAATLMAHLPPVGWADVATKRDLDELERRLETRIEATLHREISHLQRFFVTAMFAWGSVLVTVAFAVGKAS